MSLRRLFEETRQLLLNDPNLVAHFDASFYAAIGSGWRDAMDECYDWELAQDSLAFFDARAIPKIESAIHPAVSDVRFCSDLSAVTPLGKDDLLEFRSLLAAARPSAV